MKKYTSLLYALFTLCLAVLAPARNATAADLSWRENQVFYWFGESADGKTADCPMVAAGYGSPVLGRLTHNIIIGSTHASSGFAQPGAAVVAGTLSGLFTATDWLPVQSPCGNVRNTVYPVTSWTDKDDVFIGKLCRDVEHGITEGAPLQQPGDKVTWWSRSRKEWQLGEVVDWENTGRLTIVGTLAQAGDSGSPVFTYDEIHYSKGGKAGKYVGVVIGKVTTFQGFNVNAALVGVFGNPRLDGLKLPPGWKPGDVVKIGTDPVTTEIPRLPISLATAGGFLFTIASPDSSIWKLDPAQNTWTQVAILPPKVVFK